MIHVNGLLFKSIIFRCKKEHFEHAESCYDYLTFTSIFRKSTVRRLEPSESKTDDVENSGGKALIVARAK